MTDGARFEVVVNDHGDFATVVISGDLDLWSGNAQSDILAGVKRLSKPVVVDASDLIFMDSAGLRFLVEVARRQHPRRLRIEGAQPPIRRVIELSGLELLMELAD
jgi:anti-anti-sigma factor